MYKKGWYNDYLIIVSKRSYKTNDEKLKRYLDELEMWQKRIPNHQTIASDILYQVKENEHLRLNNLID